MELTAPSLTGLALAPTAATRSLGGAFVPVSLANEPLLVLVGARGWRAKAKLSQRARSDLVIADRVALGMLSARV